jgi:prephenate dehydrogenase
VKKIVVIGTGRMGGAFATAFAKRTSHAVSSRASHTGSSSAAALSRQLGVRVADDKELLAADVVFVATPPAALKGYAGIIVSAMVPGHLDASRNIEILGLLMGQLAYRSGFGDRVSLRAHVVS